MPTLILLIAAIVILTLIAAILLYKSGFRVKELKLNLLSLGEAKLTRPPDAPEELETPAAARQTQRASGAGSRIENARQRATGAGIEQTMEATGGGQIINSQQRAASGDATHQKSNDR